MARATNPKRERGRRLLPPSPRFCQGGV